MNFFSLSPRQIQWAIKLWPPFWFTGIRFDHISHDFRHIRMVMPLRFYNRNLHGIQFGGSLYAMADPCYLMMLLRNLGKGYRVLDKAASVDYIKPGTGTVVADIRLTDDDLNDIYRHTESGDKYFKNFTIDICDMEGELVAQVVKTLYIRKKQRKDS